MDEELRKLERQLEQGDLLAAGPILARKMRIAPNKLALGVDPDLHNTAFAFVQGNTVLDIAIAKISNKIKGRVAVVEMAKEITKKLDDYRKYFSLLDVVVVESQQIYTTGANKTPNPDDILLISHVSGAAVCAIQRLLSQTTEIHLPQPRVWKKQVPKEIHQARIYEKLGWDFEVKSGYTVPKNSQIILPDTSWKHAGDAIGLAMWGQEL